MAAHLSQPAPLDLTGNVAENWRKFKQRFSLYNVASGISKKDDATQTSMLLHVIGDAALDVYNTFVFNDGENMKLKKVMEKYEEYCNPKKNLTYERHQFFTRSQMPNETIDQYVTELRNKSKSCEFGELKDSLIRDRLICGVPDNALRERLLREDDPSLEKALKLCRAAEMTKTHAKELGDEKSMTGPTTTVDAVKKKSYVHANQKGQKGKSQKKSTSDISTTKPCRRCGTKHDKRECPAYGKTCHKCGRPNHFSQCCRSSSKRVNTIEVEREELFIDTITKHGSDAEWKLTLEVNNSPVLFKLDTGAQINLISEKVYHSLKPTPTLCPVNVKVMGYSGVEIPTKGQCSAKVKYKGTDYNLILTVTEGNHQPLLGLHACDHMGLIQRVNNINTEIHTNFADVFEGLGCLPGKHHISLKDDAIPVQHSCRKVLFPIRSQLKQELHRMQEINVITKVEEPTDWVSSLVIVEKKNGKLRVCLDPRDLNRAIKREHYQLPSRAEITAHFAGAKYFSKLDASCGFWQLQLDEQSSKLTTFITPFGRFRFLRLPFGICSAPEVYQKVIQNLFIHIKGVNTMMDDIVSGATKAEHDERLQEVLQTARKANLKLNREKCQFGVNRLTFIGDVISDQGIEPDPKKIAAIQNMPPPTSKKDLQRFLGMVNYLGKFIPDLSTKTAELRNLLKKENEWIWSHQHETSWKKLKEALMTEPILQFYDPEKPVRVSADASKEGIGAVLLQQQGQEWVPVAYASRAMTIAETKYAQIEKELLAITYACERFHQYIYGQRIQVETDHKPLVPLFIKPLCDCPLRIQRLLIRVQRYDLEVNYTPGKFMYTADTLSRAVDAKAESIQTKEEDINIYVNAVLINLQVSSNRKAQIADETQKDVIMQTLTNCIVDGWPNDKRQCPPSVQDFWNVRNELSIAEGIIFKGSKIVIPGVMRELMLQKVHEGHLGIEKCKRRAREVMYWPRINEEVAQMVQKCSSCLLYKPKQQRETLQPHNVPNKAWEKVASDLFTLNNKNYVVTVDYFSQFIEVSTLGTTSSKSVINSLKSIFARHGTPCEMVTDNGTQFSSQEFKEFAEEWDFVHSTSSPHYPRSNGLAENAVKIVKNLMLKASNSNQDVNRALQIYRSSPLECGKSPAELLYNRRIRSNLPTANCLMEPQEPINKKVRQHKSRVKERQKEYHDQHARDLPPLNRGDKVRVQDTITNKWSHNGVVLDPLPNRSYIVKLDNDSVRRRNRRHIRPVN